ncbi:MAG: T9SS type A sorting domain-containing protein, partial [Ignavibacteriaceae bacterium]|nr:T9SS type A sorting domain-containing protein [Ignavibacteriaceae bacterium]
IKYSLKDEGRVTVKIFNTLGEEIRTLVDEIKSAGNYNLEFNANNLPSGVYIYRLQSGEFVSSKKMLLIK